VDWRFRAARQSRATSPNLRTGPMHFRDYAENVPVKSTQRSKMTMSIEQSRQQLSALIAAAQHQPQVITKRNTPVAVLVSADYFKRSEAAVTPVAENFYSQLLRLRDTYVLQDDSGLAGPTPFARETTWQRANASEDRA
jgi:prevent-host-death family protein